MVQWTTPFMIGITQMISNSNIPPPSSGYSISFPNQPKKFRKVEDGCVDIYFYDWLYFSLRLLNHISALSTVKRYKFSQSTFNIVTTTYYFSKSPSKSCSGCTSGRQKSLLREEDSNLRPLGYEPSELPLLYLAIWWRWRDSNPRLQKYK